MICLDFDWQIDEFMVYCRSTQLRERSMKSYEQTLRLFERWCMEEMNITAVDKVTEPVIRRDITDLQTRGKYTFALLERVMDMFMINVLALFSYSSRGGSVCPGHGGDRFPGCYEQLCRPFFAEAIGGFCVSSVFGLWNRNLGQFVYCFSCGLMFGVIALKTGFASRADGANDEDFPCKQHSPPYSVWCRTDRDVLSLYPLGRIGSERTIKNDTARNPIEKTRIKHPLFSCPWQLLLRAVRHTNAPVDFLPGRR